MSKLDIKENHFRDVIMGSLACLLALLAMATGEMLEDGELVKIEFINLCRNFSPVTIEDSQE